MKISPKLILCLAPLFLNTYGYIWRNLPDAWVYRSWTHEGLIVSLLALMAGALVGIARFRRFFPTWLLASLFVAQILASPLLFLATLMGWGIGTVVPPQVSAQTLSMKFNIQSSLPACFETVRLIFHRDRSIMQGTSRVTYIVGHPRPLWKAAFGTLPLKEAETEKTFSRGCELTNPLVWVHRPCESQGIPASFSCYSCTTGNWNHSQDHVLVFSAQHPSALYFAGTGPSLTQALAQTQTILDQDPQFVYRYPEFRTPPDSTYDSVFNAVLSSKSITIQPKEMGAKP